MLILTDTTLTTQVGVIAGHLWDHWEDVFAGATGIAIVGHAVNSFPTPGNVYGQWLLGVVKYAVGQRISAANALAGLQTEATAVTTEQKNALANGSTMEVVKTSDGVLKPIREGKH